MVYVSSTLLHDVESQGELDAQILTLHFTLRNMHDELNPEFASQRIGSRVHLTNAPLSRARRGQQYGN